MRLSELKRIISLLEKNGYTGAVTFKDLAEGNSGKYKKAGKI
ncbi:MAG: hypothetical protein ACRCU6_04280 [Fusobacteriaceae bacterium]